MASQEQHHQEHRQSQHLLTRQSLIAPFISRVIATQLTLPHYIRDYVLEIYNQFLRRGLACYYEDPRALMLAITYSLIFEIKEIENSSFVFKFMKKAGVICERLNVSKASFIYHWKRIPRINLEPVRPSSFRSHVFNARSEYRITYVHYQMVELRNCHPFCH